MGGISMYFVKSVIDIFMVLLLLRLVIQPNEAYFNPIYRLIYRITDPVLIPFRYVTRDATKGVLMCIVGLVVLRGLVFLAISPMSVISGISISFLNLFQLLFQAYMVMWFVFVLSQRAFGTSFLNLIQRAFAPIFRIAGRFGIRRGYSPLFVFLFLWISYALLNVIIRTIAVPRIVVSPLLLVHGFADGLMLVLGLFTFPGFFSLVIVVGAVLSWVSPDPSNPIVQAIYGISEPLLSPFRRFVPLLGGIDFSPIIAIFCFQILGGLGQQLIAGLLRAL